MLLRRLSALCLALVLLAPAVAAQGRAGGVDGSPAVLPPSAKAYFESLPPDVQRGLIAECDDDLACYREAMRRYRRQTSRGTDRESPVGVVDAPRPTDDRVRTASARPEGQTVSASGSSSSVEVPFPMPARLADAFAQLPPDVQAEMVERCDDTLDCYRRAMRRYRENQGEAAGVRGGTVSAAPASAAGTPEPLPERPRPPMTPEDLLRPPSRPLPTTAQTPCDSMRDDHPDWDRLGCGSSGDTEPTTTTPPTTSPSPTGDGTGQGGTIARIGGFEPGADPVPGPRDARPGRPDLSPATDTGGRRAPDGYERPTPNLPGPVRDDDDDDEPVARPTAEPEAAFVHFFYGSTSPTGITGEGGDWDIEKQPGDGAYLIGIEAEEQSDVPCGFRFLWYRDNDTGGQQGYFTTRGGDCPSTVNWNDDWGTRYHENATIDHLTDPDDDEVRAVKSIEVCMNNDADRIKGIRVWGAHIDRDGRVSSDDNLYGSFARPNCNDNWSTERTCPSGEVAVGTEVEFGEAHDMVHGTSDNNASGMRLICADPYTESN